TCCLHVPLHMSAVFSLHLSYSFHPHIHTLLIINARTHITRARISLVVLHTTHTGSFFRRSIPHILVSFTYGRVSSLARQLGHIQASLLCHNAVALHSLVFSSVRASAFSL